MYKKMYYIGRLQFILKRNFTTNYVFDTKTVLILLIKE